MKALIDTHVFLWWNTEDAQLSSPRKIDHRGWEE